MEEQSDKRIDHVEDLLDAAEEAWSEDDIETASRYYHDARTLYIELGLDESVADTSVHIGDLAADRENWAAASLAYTEALDIYRRINSSRGEINVLIKLGEIAIYADHLSNAAEYYTTALDVSQRIKDTQLEADVLFGLASLARYKDELEQAEDYFEQALALYEEPLSQANAYLALGQISAQIDDFQQARPYYEAALSRFRRNNYLQGEADVLINLANLMRRQGLYEAAKHHFDSALALGAELEQERTAAAAWSGMALLSLYTEPDDATEYLNKALALRDQMGDRYSRAADLANFGAELLQVNRPRIAILYFEEAFEILDSLELEALRERVGEKLYTAKALSDQQDQN